jgi:HD superfamily phosphohydrolase YqeK
MNNNMNPIDIILNDNYIIETFDKISSLENSEPNEYGVAHHGLIHSINVSKTIEYIMNKLNYSYDYIIAGRVSAIMHDLGCINGKSDHASRSHEIAKKYLKKLDIKYKKEILNAILNHSNCTNASGDLDIILFLADKLDIAKDRVGPGGYDFIGMRQLQYIEKIIIYIENQVLTVEFLTSSALNFEELNNFYFIDKVFDSIKKFSNKFSLSYKIIINKKVWNRGIEK